MALETVAPATLPEDLRGMDKPALKAEIEKRAGLRKAAQDELTKVAKQRDEYLKAQAKDGNEDKDGFDAKVNAAIDAQLKR
jgi:ABC-type amino acid transport substrate-binding protein